MDTGDSSSRQVRVRFVTKLEAPLKVPANPIAIPSNLTRMGLSEIVNEMIVRGNSGFEKQPFDFIVDGELIRLPMEQFLLAKGISAERTLEIEYIKAVVPRREEDPLPHDDWVSAVDGSNSSFILTGCYDSLARVWRSDSLCTHILEGHEDAITSVCIMSQKERSNDRLRVVTASKDRSLRLWKFNLDNKWDHMMRLAPYAVLSGHTKSVQSISGSPSGNMVCSGSWDCSIKLWNVEDNGTEGESVSVKKRKVNVDDMETHEESQLEGTAVSTLAGHTQCVSAVVWSEPETICSASWDHSIRIWDAETGTNSWNMVSGKAFNCLDIGGESSALLVAGGSDPVIRVWDPRKPGTLAPVFQFSTHSSWIASCKWHKKSWFHFVSASYDGKVMLWDLRTAWPLAVIDSHADKVLCVDWWKDDNVISGGADSKLCISSEISII